MKKYFILVLIVMSCSTSDDSATTPPTTQVTPESWGSWSPNFSAQIANFTQSRTSNKGNRETRNITVTKQTSIVETNERYTQQDFNGDGDLIDYINLIEDTYTASNNLGSRVVSSSELSINQDLNFLTRNFGLWAGGPTITESFTQTWGSVWTNAGESFELPSYLAWDVTDSAIDSYSSSNNGGCWNLVESELTYDSFAILELTLIKYTSRMNGVPVGEVLTEANAATLIEGGISKVDIITIFDITNENNTSGVLTTYNNFDIGVFKTGSTGEDSIFYRQGYLYWGGFGDAEDFTCPASSGRSISKKMFEDIKLDSRFKNLK